MPNFKEIQFESIPKTEKVLKEGIMQNMRLFGNKTIFTFKYALTDKGIWTKNKKSLFVKSKEVFIAYSDLDSYKDNKYGINKWFIFFPKNKKKPGSRIRFDDNDQVEIILKQFIRKIEKNDDEN